MEERASLAFRSRVNAMLGELLGKTGISPNLLTALGMLVSVLACFVIANYGLVFGAFAVLAASLFDILDGAVAKATNRTSVFGAFFDDMADRFGEIMYFGGIYLLTPSAVVFFAAVSSIWVSYTKASAQARGYKITSGLVFGRPARIILLLLAMAISPWFEMSWSLMALSALNVFTISKRFWEVSQQSA